MDAIQLLVSLLNLKFVCSETLSLLCHAGSTRGCASSGWLRPIPLLICGTEEWEKIRLQARPRLYNTLVTTVARRPSSLWSPLTDFASHPLISPRCPLTLRHSHHHCILQQSTCRLGLLLYYVSVSWWVRYSFRLFSNQATCTARIISTIWNLTNTGWALSTAK